MTDCGIQATTVPRSIVGRPRSEEHTSELQSQSNLVCRLLLEKKNTSRFQVPWVLLTFSSISGTRKLSTWSPTRALHALHDLYLVASTPIIMHITGRSTTYIQ